VAAESTSGAARHGGVGFGFGGGRAVSGAGRSGLCPGHGVGLQSGGMEGPSGEELVVLPAAGGRSRLAGGLRGLLRAVGAGAQAGASGAAPRRRRGCVGQGGGSPVLRRAAGAVVLCRSSLVRGGEAGVSLALVVVCVLFPWWRALEMASGSAGLRPDGKFCFWRRSVEFCFRPGARQHEAVGGGA